ncbi:MAG: hypothetical protein ACSLFB_02555 [Acidimicrobiales bacterium]
MATTVVVDTMIASAWLGLRRSQRVARWALVLDDDRPHEAPGAFPVADDNPPADVRGGRKAVR